MLQDLPEMPAELRRELTDYYKWVVNLATFVLTLSLSLTALLGRPLCGRGWLVAGWLLLAICIFFNWMLIKTMLSLAAAATTPPDARTELYRVMFAGIGVRLRIYGNIQNAAFLLGMGLVAVGFAVSL